MALFRTLSAAIQGIDAHIVDVEVDMYPAGSNRDFVTVGMPDAAVKESRHTYRRDTRIGKVAIITAARRVRSLV